jgi:hypothetical protein
VDIQGEKREIPRQLILIPLFRHDQTTALRRRGEKQPVQMDTMLRSRAIVDTLDSIANEFASIKMNAASTSSEPGKVNREHEKAPDPDVPSIPLDD